MAIINIEVWKGQCLRSNYGYLKIEEWQGQCLRTNRRAFCIKCCCLFVQCGIIFSARHVVSLLPYACLFFFAKHWRIFATICYCSSNKWWCIFDRIHLCILCEILLYILENMVRIFQNNVLYFLQYSRVFFMSYCGIFSRLWHYISESLAILKIEIWQWQCLKSNYGFLNVEVWQGRIWAS